jgi:hypothetical protein
VAKRLQWEPSRHKKAQIQSTLDILPQEQRFCERWIEPPKSRDETSFEARKKRRKRKDKGKKRGRRFK